MQSFRGFNKNVSTKSFFLDLTLFCLGFLTLQTAARGLKYIPSIISSIFFTVVKHGISV